MSAGKGSERRSQQGGYTLIELLAAAAIAIFVLFGLGTLYLATTRNVALGSAQAFVQRQGTLVEEELSRLLLSATGVSVGTTTPACGPGGSAAAALLFTRTDDSRWCVYEFADVGDSFPQLYVCQLQAAPATACAGQARNLLAGAVRAVAEAELRVANTTFTPLPGALTSAVNIRFDLTDGTLYSPLRFGLSVYVRN